jgi:D-alanyl-D-alanine endopeptidase (penicillin-binding protein 7)
VQLLIVALFAVIVASAFPSPANAQSARSAPSAQKSAKQGVSKAVTRPGAKRKRAVLREPPRPSEGQLAGLHRTDDPLDLKSAVALVVDQDTDRILFQKNSNAVLPIASITKLMTALITVEAELDPDEPLVVGPSDRTVDRVRSRLNPGVRLTRAQALQLALMSSENHAAQLLGRTYPGGLVAAVAAMNAKAQLLGMHDTHFADPTGLSSENRSSPADLVRLVKAAYEHPVIGQYSTSSDLTASPNWEIGLQKTGYISAAGRCLVMQAVIEGQRLVIVLLDSVGRYSRIGDAQRIRQWLEASRPEARLPRV